VTVEIGVGLQADKAAGAYARLASIAEAGGVDVVSVFGDLLYQPPIVALLEMARATERVRLGASCWNPYTLHPYEIAGQVAALDRATGGRAYVGLARGAWLGQLGLTQPRPVTYLREAVSVIRALLTGDPDGSRGTIFPLTPGATLRYPTRGRMPPVLIGAWGPKAAALAGEVADEIKVGGSANPELVGVIRDRLRPGCARAGRSVEQIRIVFGAVTVVDEDGEAARARARREVAMYLAVVAELDPTESIDPRVVADIARFMDAGETDRAARLIDDDVLDRFAFSGDPKQVADHAQRLIDAGVGRVDFGTPHGLADDRGMELLVEQVIPRLRR
jgi:5,10-methylenetetrahydromethanopterin reductase